MLTRLVPLLLLALWPSSLSAQFASVRIEVIDVGQADAILIRTPNTHWILIDAGQSRVLGDSLRSKFGVDELEVAVASHRHRDHIGGMDDVVGRVPIRTFIGDTAEYFGGTDDDRMRDSLRVKEVRLHGTTADTLVVDHVRLIILPRPTAVADEENNNSVLIRVEFGQFSALFTGDLEEAGLAWLVDTHADLLDVDVLKASHHGSRNGTSPSWLDAVAPDHVVISAGVHRGFQHPHAEAVDAYAAATGGRVFCTNRHGTLRVYGFSDGRVQINRQRASSKSCTYDGT